MLLKINYYSPIISCKYTDPFWIIQISTLFYFIINIIYTFKDYISNTFQTAY